MKLTTAKRDSFEYNAIDTRTCDREGNHRVYSVVEIKDGIAIAQSQNAWGGINEENVPVEFLKPWIKTN